MRRPEGHPVIAALLDLVMAPLEGLRHRVVPAARGRVLEVGVGTGLNAAAYDRAAVERLVGVEPDPHMLARARPRYAALGAELVRAGAEDMPFDDASFDAVVLTFTLCTIPDAEGAVREMFRVLAPGGSLHFAEHTASDHAATRAVQRAIDPVWSAVAGGCHLSRDAVALLSQGGFTVTELHGHGRGMLNLTPVHRGIAVKPG